MPRDHKPHITRTMPYPPPPKNSNIGAGFKSSFLYLCTCKTFL